MTLAHTLLEVLKGRRSVRAFLSDPIPEEHLRMLLEAVRWAPSAGNIQPWRVYLVRDEGVKKQLVIAAYGQRFIAEAPVVFVLAGLPELSGKVYGERGRRLYVIQDVAAATQNLILMAYSLGYGSCWVGAFDERAVSEALDIPEDVVPLCIVPVGRPRRIPKAPRRKHIEEFVFVI